jgi:hypothetical protein
VRSKPIDMTGKTIGRLKVLGRAPGKANGGVKWRCRCSCGKTKMIFGQALRDPKGTTSCGCARREKTVQRSTKHGHATRGGKSKEWFTWIWMRARCADPKAKDWKLYGGRGISVCPKWRASFAAFLKDVGPAPSPTHQIDRIDNDGNYEPGNVRWASPSRNCRNRRSTIRLTAGGKTMTLPDWADALGVSRDRLYEAVRRSGPVALDRMLQKLGIVSVGV